MSTHRVKDTPPSMSNVPHPTTHERSNWVRPEKSSPSSGVDQETPVPPPHMPVPPVPVGGVEDEALNDLLMAWYYRCVLQNFSYYFYD